MSMGNYAEYQEYHDDSPITCGDYRPFLYKNWMYINYKSEPFMELWEGRISFIHEEVKLVATRWPQSGIYFVMWSGYAHLNTLIRVSGIGRYGWGEDEEWKGVLPESKDFLKEFVKKTKWEIFSGMETVA